MPAHGTQLPLTAICRHGRSRKQSRYPCTASTQVSAPCIMMRPWREYKEMHVAVETSQARGLSMPQRLRLRGRDVEVVEVLDQWFGPDCRYCKVKGSDHALYILRVDESRSEWNLIMFASPKAQSIAPQSGAGAHPHPSTNKEIRRTLFDAVGFAGASEPPTLRSGLA
jgi:hypothetical protein